MFRAKTVVFDSFSDDENNYSFNYLIDEVPYTIHLSHSTPTELEKVKRLTILFNLGMCYLIDLAELTVPDEVHINFALSDLQFNFWQTLYQEVSKEKMFVEKLDLSLLESNWSFNKAGQSFESFDLSSERTKVGLCLTGGKESLTLLKILKNKVDLQLFFLDPETSVHRQKVLERTQQEFSTIRTISNRTEIFRALKQKYESRLASGVDMAHLVFHTLLQNNKYVLIGNEYSSNFPNLVYQGYPINHQYVKSLYFAQKLNDYLHQFVTKDFSYFSPFFGMYEYKIASQLFITDEYLEVWTSCNRTTPLTNFCCNCHKCAFTYLVGLLYTSPEFLQTFFSRDLLEDVELYRPLMDFTGQKPLDCVGEKIEVWVALNEQLSNSAVKDKPVLRYFSEKIKPFIDDELPEFKKEVTTTQTVPEKLPAEISLLTQQAYKESAGFN